jgi:hypothetical protein
MEMSWFLKNKTQAPDTTVILQAKETIGMVV